MADVVVRAGDDLLVPGLDVGQPQPWRRGERVTGRQRQGDDRARTGPSPRAAHRVTMGVMVVVTTPTGTIGAAVAARLHRSAAERQG
ncbi:hypothetical protein AB0K25_21150 [Micromonospora sp. NPDC049257]|uniref:hypothetical protein n=1 Tax=Micromonospora sp. NPDC049257 TaxID=3155771 RepID=UPI003446ED6C